MADPANPHGVKTTTRSFADEVVLARAQSGESPLDRERENAYQFSNGAKFYEPKKTPG